jgi:hypothetical protein
MNIYSNLIKFFKHSGNYILIKLIMNIHEYSKILDYFFDTLELGEGAVWKGTQKYFAPKGKKEGRVEQC